MENVLCENHHGFRPGKSTNYLKFTFKMMLGKSWEWGINKMALFMDMEKAFDRVKREGLWNIMMDERYSIPKKLTKIIKNIYSCCIGKV